jgi:hypothetical protein
MDCRTECEIIKNNNLFLDEKVKKFNEKLYQACIKRCNDKAIFDNMKLHIPSNSKNHF